MNLFETPGEGTRCIIGDGVAGHDAWKRYFSSAVKKNCLAHAYLFLGPESVGKFTFARRLAAKIVCKDPSPGPACGACSGCKRLEGDAHPDVYISDPVAAGSRGLGVEEARERVVAAFRLTPNEAPLRIVLMNDADRMEPAAQNAILKTLEEPPPRSLLILIARDSTGLLDTVLSRCFLMRFSTVPDAQFAAFLSRSGRTDAEIEKWVRVAAGVPGRAIALADEGVSLAELAAQCLAGSLPAVAVAKRVSEAAADQTDKSVFERRRKASIAFCASLAFELRHALATHPDDFGLASRLDRVVEGAAELVASATPELVTDRLILDVMPRR